MVFLKGERYTVLILDFHVSDLCAPFALIFAPNRVIDVIIYEFCTTVCMRITTNLDKKVPDYHGVLFPTQEES